MLKIQIFFKLGQFHTDLSKFDINQYPGGGLEYFTCSKNILYAFILIINQLDAQNLYYNKFISCLYMFRAPCAHRQEVKIVLYSLWYHHTHVEA